ncbi:MAG: hypothetical protein U0237_15710 [Thermoleophilia bacterium]
MMNGGWGAMTPFGWAMMVVLWVSVIGLVVWAMTRIFPGTSGAARDRGSEDPGRDEASVVDPLALLERRLATGEVDPETYDRIRERLDAARQPKEVR